MGVGDGTGVGLAVGGVGCSCPYPPALALIAKAIRKAMVDLLIDIQSIVSRSAFYLTALEGPRFGLLFEILDFTF